MSFLGFVASLGFADNRKFVSENTVSMGNDKESKETASFERLEEMLTSDLDGVCDLAKYL